MPTPESAMANAKATLGWDESDPAYKSWRRAIKSWAAVKGWTSKRQLSHDQWDEFMEHAVEEKGFRKSASRLLLSGTDLQKSSIKEALDFILQDALKKSRDTTNRYTRQQVANLAAEAPNVSFMMNEDAAVQCPALAGRSVRIFVVDPSGDARHNKYENGEYKWDGCRLNMVTVLKDETLAGIVGKVQEKVKKRTIREVYGAMNDPPATGEVPDPVRLQKDEEVTAFLETTSSDPIRFQVILYRKEGDKEDSPAPLDGEYFEQDMFAEEELYEDYVDDSDAMHRNLSGQSKRSLPKSDMEFEVCKQKVRERIRRQEAILAKLTAAHEAKYPDVKPLGPKRSIFSMLEELVPPPKTGKELIAAREALNEANITWGEDVNAAGEDFDASAAWRKARKKAQRLYDEQH